MLRAKAGISWSHLGRRQLSRSCQGGEIIEIAASPTLDPCDADAQAPTIEPCTHADLGIQDRRQGLHDGQPQSTSHPALITVQAIEPREYLAPFCIRDTWAVIFDVDDVIVETIHGLSGVRTVLYVKIGPNIDRLSAKTLAELAIHSVQTAPPGDDGITYLMDVKRCGVETPLTRGYESEILRQTRTRNLRDAVNQLRSRNAVRRVAD